MASAYLTRNVSCDRQTWTWSAWVKRSKTDSYQNMFAGGTSGSADTAFNFNADGALSLYHRESSSLRGYFESSRKLRDNNGWYHLVANFDATNGTGADRLVIYVNGERAAGTMHNTLPQNDSGYIGNGSAADIGRMPSGTASYFDGQMTHIHFVDGTIYGPSTFGETDATTGIWKAKTSPTVTYGSGGFFLKMDNSGNMGLDSSGNSNNFTTSGTIIQAKDTPSNVFCTNNSLWKQESTRYLTHTKVNTMVSGGGSSTWYQTPGTLAFSKGKYYWECKFNSSTNLDKNTAGVIDYEKTQESGQFQDKTVSVFFKNEDGGDYRLDASTVNSNWGTLAQNDILGVAVDMDAGTPTVKYYKNGTLLGTVNASSLSGKFVTPAHMVYTSGEYQVNYGNGYFGTTAVSSAQNPSDGIGIFEYSVPSGYKALCTKSINAQEYS